MDMDTGIRKWYAYNIYYTYTYTHTNRHTPTKATHTHAKWTPTTPRHTHTLSSMVCTLCPLWSPMMTQREQMAWLSSLQKYSIWHCSWAAQCRDLVFLCWIILQHFLLKLHSRPKHKTGYKKCPKEHILWTMCRCSSRTFCGLSSDSHHAV